MYFLKLTLGHKQEEPWVEGVSLSLSVSLSLPPCLCLFVSISLSMPPCLCLFVSLSLPPCLCLSVSVYASLSLPLVSLSVSLSLPLVSISDSLTLCLYVSITSPYIEVCIRSNVAMLPSTHFTLIASSLGSFLWFTAVTLAPPVRLP